MEQVKLFKGVEMELTALEKEINAWIQETKARVISVSGNIAPQSGHSTGTFGTSDILVIVTYEA